MKRSRVAGSVTLALARNVLPQPRHFLSIPVVTIAEKQHVYSVSELTRNVKGILESAFRGVWIEGELSGGKVAVSGHFYGTLKDERAQLDVVMWKGQVRKLGFALENGTHYLCYGNISVYEVRGTYQLSLERVEPAGLGALQLKFEQLKTQLAKEGLFDEGHKKPLPEFPRRIGVVTSATGAAIRDILSVLQRRFHGVEIFVHHAAVQGTGAAAEIAHGIDVLDRLGRCDVLIVGRGGGSLEDLWPFNEEAVARAMYTARTPIISAVGHEVDFTIADFVADMRAPTPSAAAELVVQERGRILETVMDARRRLDAAAVRHLMDRRNNLRLLAGRYGFKRPPDMVAQGAQSVDRLSLALGRETMRVWEAHRARVDRAKEHLRLLSPQAQVEQRQKRLADLTGRLRSLTPLRRVEQNRRELAVTRGRLVRAGSMAVQRSGERLARLAGRLDDLSPLKVLARGFSVTTAAETGKVLTSATQAVIGDRIGVRLAAGRLHCTVDGIQENGDGQEGG